MDKEIEEIPSEDKPMSDTKTVTKTVTVFSTKNSVIRLNPKQPDDLNISNVNEDDDDDDGNDDDDDGEDDDDEDARRRRALNEATDICDHLKRHFAEVTVGHQPHMEVQQEHYKTHVVDVLSRLLLRPVSDAQLQIETVHSQK